MNDQANPADEVDVNGLIARVRSGMGDPSYVVEVEDNAVDVARVVANRISQAVGDRPKPKDYPAAVERATLVENVSRPAITVAATIAAFEHEDRASHLLTRIVQITAGAVPDDALSEYPPLLVWYAAGTILASRWRLSALRHVGLRSRLLGRQQPVAGVVALQPWQVFSGDDQLAQWIAQQGQPDRRLHTPISQRLQTVLAEIDEFDRLFDSDFDLETVFDRFEWAAGLLLTDVRLSGAAAGWYVPPVYVGSFGWRDRYLDRQGRWSELARWGDEVADVLIEGDEEHRRAVVDAHREGLSEF